MHEYYNTIYIIYKLNLILYIKIILHYLYNKYKELELNGINIDSKESIQ